MGRLQGRLAAHRPPGEPVETLAMRLARAPPLRLAGVRAARESSASGRRPLLGGGAESDFASGGNRARRRPNGTTLRPRRIRPAASVCLTIAASEPPALAERGRVAWAPSACRERVGKRNSFTRPGRIPRDSPPPVLRLLARRPPRETPFSACSPARAAATASSPESNARESTLGASPPPRRARLAPLRPHQASSSAEMNRDRSPWPNGAVPPPGRPSPREGRP